MGEDRKLKDIIGISIIKPNKYMDLLGVSIKKAILILFMICLVPGLINGISSGLLVGEGIDLVIDALEDEKNNFEIKNGILNFSRENITIEESNTILYVDSNTNLSEIDKVRSILVHKDVYSAFLKDGVSVSYGDTKKEFKYSEILGSETIGNKDLIEILNIATKFKFLTIVVETLTVFIDALINSLIIYLLGSLISKLKRIFIPANQMYKMSIFALMLPALLQVSHLLTEYYLIVAGAYIFIAIHSIKNDLLNLKK